MHSVTHNQESIRCKVSLPLSKSIVNRLLVIHHLSGGRPISGLLSDSSDTVVMQQLLKEISHKRGESDTITEINVGNAGTVMRFLTAVLAITTGKWLITGTERMLQRPVKPLTDALQFMGADLSFGNISGFPPVHINGKPLSGGFVHLNAAVSSQFISALMLIAPVLKGGLEIELDGDIISGSYIRMTRALMQKAGAEASFKGNLIKVKAGNYTHFGFSALLEPDWSAAAFWYQVAAFAPEARIVLTGLRKESVQGDSVLPSIYRHLGVDSVFMDDGLLITKSGLPAVKEFEYDFTECPDLAQAVIVTCAALGIKGRFAGIKTLRVKETDRIEALRNELAKLGYGVEVADDQIYLHGNQPVNQTGPSARLVNCYDDHRMAMSFAPLAMLRGDIALDDPEVVKKSYPGFWKDMALAGFELKG
jgi:3-phosphoshikimate 1-carboxyvinyltransferase